MLDDLKRAGYLEPSKQRKIEIPREPGKPRRFRGCAVRRHCQPIFYRRLGVNLEADAEKKRREVARAAAAEQARAELEAQKIRELRQLPHIKTAPAPPALTLVDDDTKNTRVRQLEEDVRGMRARWAAADRDDEPPE